MRIARVLVLSTSTMGVFSWPQLPNLWSWKRPGAPSLPPGWNPVNRLPPCGPEGPSHHRHPPESSSSSEALPLLSTDVAATTPAQGTMNDPSPSALANAFSSMNLSPVATGGLAAATTSLLAESALPINPAASQVLPLVSSQGQQIVPAASTGDGVLSPPASSEVPELSPPPSATGELLSPMYSQVQDPLQFTSAAAEVIDQPASSLVEDALPSTLVQGEDLAPSTPSMVQESMLSASAQGGDLSPPISIAQDAIASDSAVDANTAESVPTPAIRTMAVLSSFPEQSLMAQVSEGQAVDSVTTNFANPSAPASQTEGPLDVTSQESPKKTLNLASPHYHNHTMHSSNATVASNGTSHNATMTTSIALVESTDSSAIQCVLPKSPMCCTPTEAIKGGTEPAQGYTCKPAMYVGPTCSGVSLCCGKPSIDDCEDKDKETVLPPVMFSGTN